MRITEFYLKTRYGEAIEMEYVDMADTEKQAQFPELLAVVEERDLPYPLLAINGHVRAAGSVHYYHVLPLVEEAFEAVTAEQET